MFRVHCDWCGEVLYKVDHARLDVAIKREGGTRREREWAEEVRPTLHFCVNERTDFNRMGIEGAAQDDAGSCFAKAMAAVRGTELEPPPRIFDEIPALNARALRALQHAGITTMGQLAAAMDADPRSVTRLSGIGAGALSAIRAALAGDEPAPGAALRQEDDPSPARRDPAPPSDSSALPTSAADATIGHLRISVRTYNALDRAGIRTLPELQQAVKARKILALPGIGQVALDEIECALDEMLRELQHTTTGGGEGNG